MLALAQAEAEGIVAADPAVRDQIVTATVHPWYVTVAGRIQVSGRTDGGMQR